MLNWSDKLLDRVEATLDRSGWLGKTADAVLARLLPHGMAHASCDPCWCDTCDPPWWGVYCWVDGQCVYDGGPCPDRTPC